MKWNRFTIKTKTDAEDMIICTLAEIGVEGAEIQDHQPLTEEDKAQMFVDIMPEGPEDDGVAYLNFYLEEDADKDVILRDVRNALEELRTFMDIGEGTIEESQTEDKDWINNWKKYFKPIPVGEKLLIRPLWEDEYDAQGRTVLHLEPGLAFGTAGCAAVHATSYPLGGKYHVAHGESNYAMFTGVMKQYLAIRSDGAIAELNAFLAQLLDCPPEAVYEALEDLLSCLLPKKALHEYGMQEHELAEFTDSVLANQQRLLQNNFVPLSREQIYAIYRSLY